MFVAVVATTGYLGFSKIVSADVSGNNQSQIVLVQGWQTIDNQYSAAVEKNDMIVLYRDKLYSLAQASSEGTIEYNFSGLDKIQPGQSWKVKSNKKEVKLITK